MGDEVTILEPSLRNRRSCFQISQRASRNSPLLSPQPKDLSAIPESHGRKSPCLHRSHSPGFVHFITEGMNIDECSPVFVSGTRGMEKTKTLPKSVFKKNGSAGILVGAVGASSFTGPISAQQIGSDFQAFRKLLR